ncbi:uncharacterized protein LOC143434583 [Arvicanthis niloticus]|uniref:uncharacterized protein LOC143434583 n=1 Tax=Arvicanthis niloticus TaxID=61156 RepID=UPI00403D5354
MDVLEKEKEKTEGVYISNGRLSCPIKALATPGSSFSTVDRGVRSAPARPGAPLIGDHGSSRRRARTGCGAGGPADSGWRHLLPSRSLRLPPRPRSRPRGSPPGVLRAGAVSWLRAEQQGRAASSHSELLRPPPPSLRCTGGPGSRRSRPLPRAASLVPSSASPPEDWDQSSARGSRDARPVRARLGGGRRRQSRGAGTPEGAGSDGLGSAAATPLGVPGLPTPQLLGSTGPVPRAGQPTLPRPARAAEGLEGQTELRKGLAEGGWMGSTTSQQLNAGDHTASAQAFEGCK